MGDRFTIYDKYVLLFECVREFLIAGLKLCPSLVEGKFFPLLLEEFPLRLTTISVRTSTSCAPRRSSPRPPVPPPTHALSAGRSPDAASGQPERAPIAH
jgi:hypothetical protein